jgi:hypothetical protein
MTIPVRTRVRRARRRLGCGLLVWVALAGSSALTHATAPPVALDPGQSATRLPDGRWLLLGGVGPTGPRADAWLLDPRTGQMVLWAPQLGAARAGHTATLLADGTVIVLGGLGADGRLVATGERVDVPRGTIEPVPDPGLTPRASHSTTVLTDGSLLVVGGFGEDGSSLPTVERWDLLAGGTAMAAASLTITRAGHTATLLADGRVLVWGGAAGNGSALISGDLYDPVAGTVTPVSAPPSATEDAGPLALVGSLPADGEPDAPLDRPLALRFAPPVAPDSVTAATVELRGPAGIVPTQVVAVEDGRLVFVTPDAPLAPGTAYTLTLAGWMDAAGTVLPLTAIRFTTGGIAVTPLAAATVTPDTGDADVSVTESGPGDGVWRPDPSRGLDGWRTGLPPSPWTQLPPLRAPPGVTALAGQVLTVWGDPLPQVTIAIGDRQARTDATGRFLLAPVPAGPQTVLIDGRSASRPTRPYGVFEVGVRLSDGTTTALGYPVWMPVLDLAHAVDITVPTPADVAVTTPLIPGLEVRLPPGTTVRDHEHRLVRELSITPIPLDRPPFPLPPDVSPPAYFTVQPGAGYVYGPHGGARIVYPNTFAEPPGRGHTFWHYDPGARGWYVYGLGRVTPDGRQIVPDLGVSVYEFTGAMVGAGRRCRARAPSPARGRQIAPSAAIRSRSPRDSSC